MADVLLHAGALGATALSICCLAASRPRVRMQELVLAVAMLLAMTDVVLGLSLVAPVWWAAVILATAMLSTAGLRDRGSSRAVRSARAMDALGAILMATLLLLMAGPGAAGDDAHAGHGVSSTALACAVVGASAVFAAASVHMAVTMRMPRAAASFPVYVLRRAAPLAMGASVLLMAAVAVV
ncbi:hypothetical protein AAIB33_00665 [Microbacterium sp. AZCO]|uniref:hypothetical protein n=1 Tax=Microbacterium sp. AZCO TaxID=3142976 RepID=UPI0031F3AA0E